MYHLTDSWLELADSLIPQGYLSKNERNGTTGVRLAYYNITVQHISHYASGTSP